MGGEVSVPARGGMLDGSRPGGRVKWQGRGARDGGVERPARRWWPRRRRWQRGWRAEGGGDEGDGGEGEVRVLAGAGPPPHALDG